MILVGYGRVGSLVGADLAVAAVPFLVIEDSDTHADALKAANIELIVGNAAASQVLDRANLAGARCLVVAIPDPFEAGQAIEQGRKLNPGLQIIARAHSDAEVAHLTRLGADQVVMGEREIARCMIAALLPAPVPQT
ncbi:NAD-binding protein [Elstera litoralis]|uniref:NAD-binding protein n=1 Tax=Elstera litoralis TaxID=552518 RepID=UPI001E4532A9|nr:NAD-binding protein [Elstera litoralis]